MKDRRHQSQTAEIACEIDMLRSLKKRASARRRRHASGSWNKKPQRQLAGRQLARAARRFADVHLQLICAARTPFIFPLAAAALRLEQFHGPFCRTTCRSRACSTKSPGRRGVEKFSPGTQGHKVTPKPAFLFARHTTGCCSSRTRRTKISAARARPVIYNSLHDRNIIVDFARPSEDLSKYKIVFTPSLHLLSSNDSDAVETLCPEGGTLIARSTRPGG